MSPERRVLLDTDPGIDDALAILLAVASQEIHLEGLTVVHGNCSLEQGVSNALAVLELASAGDVPVVPGFPRPLVQPPLIADETHGPNGLGYAELDLPRSHALETHAVDFIIEKVLSHPGELTIVAVGPLTNIAIALRREPEIIDAVQEIIIMGGAILHQGNVTPLAEYNTYADPHAAHMVYHSGLPIRLVPLDVTYQCILTAEHVDRLLAHKSPIATFIAEATRFYMEFHDHYQSVKGCVINDPLALSLVFKPELCEYQTLHVDVDISGGVSMGNTFADFYNVVKQAPKMRVALDVRPEDFIQLFLERMEGLMESLKRE
ncbi:MAG: nucleoside hydrolase [Anaerolineales bacterium]